MPPQPEPQPTTTESQGTTEHKIISPFKSEEDIRGMIAEVEAKINKVVEENQERQKQFNLAMANDKTLHDQLQGEWRALNSLLPKN